MDLEFRLHAERTPNPDSIKWVVGKPLVADGTSAHFVEQPAEDVAPLARRLFDVEGVTGVFFAEPTVASLEDAIARFYEIEDQFDADIIHERAEQFSTQDFRKGFRKLVDKFMSKPLEETKA